MKLTDIQVSFWLLKNVREIWGKRTATFHRGADKVLMAEGETTRFYLILDLELSKKILISDCFYNFNHFEQACQHLESSGRPADATRRHFQSSMMFKRGKSHVESKKNAMRVLNRMESDLKKIKPLLVRHFCKNPRRFNDAAEFAEVFIEITIACLIYRSMGMSLTHVLRSFRLRKPFFYGYFNPQGVFNADVALKKLVENRRSSQLDEVDKTHMEIAEMLLTMGIDPLVASIVARADLPFIDGVPTSVFTFNPTTFVSRTCRSKTEISGLHFNYGDECYISLLPSSEEAHNNLTAGIESGLPFAAGRHACIGKSISLSILEIADEIVGTCFPGGFPRKSEQVSAGSVFLAYRSKRSNLSARASTMD